MAVRRHNFEEIFRAQDPFISQGFRFFVREVAGSHDGAALREFFIRFNGELYRASWIDKGAKVPWASDMLAALVNANAELTTGALRKLFDEMKLHFQDPLTDVIFETAGRSNAVLALIHETVEAEGQFVQLRVRALEALFTRLALGRRAIEPAAAVDETLRSLNDILAEAKRSTLKALTKSQERLVKDLQTVARLLPALTRAQTPEAPANAAESPRSQSYGEVVELLQTVAQQSCAPGPESLASVLKILRVNTSLPEWHPSSTPWKQVSRNDGERRSNKPSNGQNRGRADVPGAESAAQDSKVVLALIIDRAIAIALKIAVAGWNVEAERTAKARPADESLLNPSDPPLLESVLLDAKARTKTRHTAAALLSLLNYALSSVQLSLRAEFFAQLFLMPYRTGGIHYRLRDVEDFDIVDSEEKMDFLFEALDEESDYVRWNAATLSYQCAREHPEWFKSKHYIKLMSLLSDEHYGIRLDMMRTIRTLATFRNQEIFTVIHDISGKLAEKVYRVKDKERARVDLETALGVSLATLLERVDELQGEVLRLENRRERLLTYLEKQAFRIGEEIHHEVLNTLCGYLATAIDERDFADAQSRLGDVVTELRRIMNHLYPKDLEAEGFLATIRKRLEDVKIQMRRRAPNFTVEFDCPQDVTDDSITASLRDKSHLVLLYRIVSEAMINARKHSQGTNIALRVRQPRLGIVEIAVSDNGRGSGGPFEQSFGIDLMQRRAEDIGAEIEYKKTSPAGGTTVVIRLVQNEARMGNGSKVSGAI
jgi:signal transduction histidine kinase